MTVHVNDRVELPNGLQGIVQRIDGDHAWIYMEHGSGWVECRFLRAA